MKDVIKDMNLGVVKSMMMELEKAVHIGFWLSYCSTGSGNFSKSTNACYFLFSI
jgi:hypothetical protein